MTNVWRIYLLKDVPNYGNYCLNNKIAAMGWILKKYNDDIKAGKIEIKTYSDYAFYAAKSFDNFNSVRRLAEEIKPGDFIWTCVDKKYYLAKVSDKSHYRYNFSDEAIYYRACNELTNIDWKYVGTKKDVDEKILERMEMGQTLCRMFAEKNPNFAFGLKYSEEIYDKISNMSIKNLPKQDEDAAKNFSAKKVTEFTQKNLSNSNLTKKFFADARFIHVSASGAMGEAGIAEVWTKNFEHYCCYWPGVLNIDKFCKFFMKETDCPYFDLPAKDGWSNHYMGCGHNFYIKEELDAEYLKKFDEAQKSGACYIVDNDVPPIEEIMLEILNESTENTVYDGAITSKKTALYGAILGDIIGSRFEWNSVKTKDFEFFSDKSRFTDDTVMTIAVADGFLKCLDYFRDFDNILGAFIDSMQRWGNKYPNAGYGGKFREWLKEKNPKPYNSFGNGSAMRVSAVGWIYDSLSHVELGAEYVSKITHNHPEGIKGAQAVAGSIFLSRNGSSKEEIKNYVEKNFGYNLSRKLDEIRPTYKFDVTCQGSVPESIIAFLESENFEDAVRNAISLGGDADTQAAIAGSIAEAFYGVSKNLIKKCRQYLPQEMIEVIDKFNHEIFGKKN